MVKNSAAKLRANNEYNKRTYKTFNLRMKPYQNTIFSEHCQKYGYGKNQFLIMALTEKIERDTGKSFDEFLAEKSNENSNK